MANINKQNVSKAEEMLYRAYKDLIVYGKLFLAGDFMKSATPQFHREIGEELLSDSNKPLAIIIARGHGKALRLDQKVLTDSGWKAIGDMTATDRVYGSDGQLKDIIGFSDVVERETYKVTTRDGRSLIVSGDHLWSVKRLNGRYGNGHRVMTTNDILSLKWVTERYDKRYGTINKCYNYAIPTPSPINMPEKELPLDPYTLGVILGDGSVNRETGGVRIYSSVSDYEEIISYISIKHKCLKSIISGNAVRFTISMIGKTMLDLGLNKNVYNKFIPEEYKTGSIEQRLAVLRGLMDTDGTMSTRSSNGKRAIFTSTCRRLAYDVADIVRSLGGSAMIYKHSNKHNGYFNVSISLSMNPFRLKRKASRYKVYKNLYNAIVGIEPLGVSKVRCLSVDSEDKLFVANDYMLTHNSTLIKAKIMHSLSFAKKAHEWGFGPERNYFYGWVSSSQKKSMNNIAYIKLHLEHNERIKYYFGNKGLSLRGDRWNMEDLITANGDRLVSSSNLTSMRGDTQATIKSGALRYSGVFIDDAENEENTRTQGSRDKIVSNIMNGILPAIETNEPGCRLYLVETPVHFDSLAQNVLDGWEKVRKEGEAAVDKFAWKVITYPATQPEMPGGVLWESYRPRKILDQIKQRYIDSPQGVSGYYQEYELEVQSSENSLWGRDHINIYDGTYKFSEGTSYISIGGLMKPVNMYLGCDPATDINTKHSDYSVIMVIAVDEDDNVYVVDYERHRSIPTMAMRNKYDEIVGKPGVVDYIIDMMGKYNCKLGTVEDVAMNRTVFQDLNKEKARLHKMGLPIVPASPGGTNKVNRIYSGLNSRFANRKVFVKKHHYDLINEIVKFGPKLAHDDTIEAFYYACLHALPYGGANSVKQDKGVKRSRRKRSWVTL